MQKIEHSDWADILSRGTGYVYNDFSAHGRSGASFNVLHRAGCWTLRRAASHIPKYHFECLSAAVGWLHQNRPDNWKRCGACCPDVEDEEFDIPDIVGQLSHWLARQPLERFQVPVPLADIARETALATTGVAEALRRSEAPVCHTWPHGKTPKPSKPYCLHLAGAQTACLDWEDSVVGAAEAELRRRGWKTNQELGTEAHIEALLRDPDVSALTRGINLRDLWAVQMDGRRLRLLILEAKGKEAAGFEHYCLAECLAQVFPTSSQHLTTLLGAKKGPGHGLCWKFARRLLEGWTAQGYQPSIVVGILVPEWTPDVVWSGSRAKTTPTSYYSKPLAELRHFLETDETGGGGTKRAQAFAAFLRELEQNCTIRELYRRQEGLSFRVAVTRANAAGHFELADLLDPPTPPTE